MKKQRKKRQKMTRKQPKRIDKIQNDKASIYEGMGAKRLRV